MKKLCIDKGRNDIRFVFYSFTIDKTYILLIVFTDAHDMREPTHHFLVLIFPRNKTFERNPCLKPTEKTLSFQHLRFFFPKTLLIKKAIIHFKAIGDLWKRKLARAGRKEFSRSA